MGSSRCDKGTSPRQPGTELEHVFHREEHTFRWRHRNGRGAAVLERPRFLAGQGQGLGQGQGRLASRRCGETG